MAKETDSYPEKEVTARFEAALRGARVAGHKSMDEVKKAAKKAKAKPEKKPGK